MAAGRVDDSRVKKTDQMVSGAMHVDPVVV